MIQNVLGKLTAKVDLTADEAYSLILAIKNDELSDVQKADPYAVDVLTGVADEFGNRDPDKAYQFMRVIKESELNKLTAKFAP